MTDLLDLRNERPRPGRRRRSGRGKLLGVLFVLLLALLLIGGAVFAGGKVLDRLRGPDAPDFTGEGTGEAVVQIEPGDTAGDVADTLVEEGVVASRLAFFQVASDDPRATALQPGFYSLRLKMSAAAAFELLLDPAARLVGRVTIPEGRNVDQTLELLAKGTEIPLEEWKAAAADPSALGLPDYAKNRLEGFLFPATYEVEPGSTAVQVLTQMIDRFEQAAATVGLEEGARSLGLTPYEVVIVASLIEREVKFDDEYGKVSRVVYNRLEQKIPLGIDAAVAFGVGKNAGEPLTKSDLAKDTPYENRRKLGLPPTPIASPGEATLKGALNPVEGDILYYVLATAEGRTFFTNDYNEFLRQRDKSRAEGIFWRAAVLGRPIAHSLSPALHRAAYAALGLDWTYDAIEVGGDELPAFLDGLGPEWAGLSLTMPLKQAVLPLLDEVSDLARDVAAANTVVLRDERRVGHNTDVHGIVAALAEAGVTSAGRAVVLGGGATARSTLAALVSLGCTSPVLVVRSEPVETLAAAARLGVTPSVVEFSPAVLAGCDLLVSTLPAGAADRFAAHVADVPALLDVVYDPWPTPLAAACGGVVVSGASMLLHQAAAQVELMTGRGAPIRVMADALSTLKG